MKYIGRDQHLNDVQRPITNSKHVLVKFLVVHPDNRQIKQLAGMKGNEWIAFQ